MTQAANRPPLDLTSDDDRLFRHARAGVMAGLVELQDWSAVDAIEAVSDREGLRGYIEDMTAGVEPTDPRWDLYMECRDRLSGGAR